MTIVFSQASRSIRRAAPFLLLVLLTAACGGVSLSGEPQIAATFPPRTAPPPESNFPASVPDVAAGAQIFAEHCTRCHGVGGAGDGELVASAQVNNPGNFTLPDAARSQTPQEWFSTITNGRTAQLMPPWGDSLSAEQRWDVAMYTYTLNYSPEEIAQGETVWTGACGDACDSYFVGPGSLTDYQAMVTTSDAALRAATRPPTPYMPEFVENLDDEDAWAVVAFARTKSLANVQGIGQQVASAPPPAPAETQEVGAPSAEATSQPSTDVNGSVIGQVSNGTAGGGSSEGLEVSLYRWDDQFNPLAPLTATTDTEGNYRFDDVEINSAYAYAVAVDYRDHRFISDFVFGSGSPLELPIKVYEPTEDPSVITITGIVDQITALGTGLQIVQVYNFHNTSDRFYTTSDKISDGVFASVVMNLPPGASMIGFPNSDQRFIVSDDQTTVVDTLPVLPEEDHIVQMVYLVPYEGDAIIEQPVNYALDGQVRLLLRPETLEIVSDTYFDIGPQDVGQTTYSGYGATLQLSASDVLSFEVRGEAAATATDIQQPQVITSNNLVVIVVVALVILIAVVVGLYLYYRGRNSKWDDTRLIDALVRQIAELDEAHEKGEINHDVYQRQRQRLKARLSELMGEDDE